MAQEREAAEAAVAAAGKGDDEGTGAAAAAAAAKGPTDWLAYTVKLLAGLPAESLVRLQTARRVAVYR